MTKIGKKLRTVGGLAALVGVSAMGGCIGGAIGNELVRDPDKHDYHVHLGSDDKGVVTSIGVSQYKRSSGGMHYTHDPLFRIECGVPEDAAVTDTKHTSSEYDWAFTPDEFTFKGSINEEGIFSTIEPGRLYGE